MKAYAKYRQLSKRADDVMAMIAGIVVGLDLLLLFAAVVLRPFGMGYAALEEFPRLWQSFLAFLMAAGILKAKGHIGVDLILMKLKGRQLAILEMVILCATAMAAFFLIISSVETLTALRSFGEMTVSEVSFPMWYIYTAQVAGFLLLFLASLEMIVDRVILLAKGQTDGQMPGQQSHGVPESPH